MATSKQKEKELARLLYIQGLQPKVVAERVEVSERTVQRWITDNRWDELRKSLIATKDSQIKMMYDSLDALNRAIVGRDEGKNYPSPGEVDTISKLTASIQRLETETGLGETVTVLIKFGNHIATHYPQMHKDIVRMMDGYIETVQQ